MASAAPPSVASTKETTNYARLCRLLVDVGSQALRDTFDGIHPPAGLHGVLARHPEHATLKSLRKKRILNPTQWGKLYPTVASCVSSASFDITLLMVLLRNICGLHPPATGWDSLPLPADTSTEANIARVKYYRNTVYGHASQASVDDATFNTYWQDISNTLVALGGVSYGAAIKKLKNECMDPDMDEHYRELLKQWKKDEDSIKDNLEEIKEVFKLLKEEKGDIKEKLGEMEGNIKDKLYQVENQVGLGADKIRNDLQELKSEIGNMRSKLEEGEETRDEDQARYDFQQMRSEIRNITEKLNTTQITSREVAKDEDVFDPAEIIDGTRQLYKLREGWLAPFPWCEEFHFHLDDIYTRLKVVSRKKTRGTATTDTVDMSGIFRPHEECPQPRTVLIEGKPGMGKTTYCKKLVYDWATEKAEAEDCFPRFEAVLLLRCRDMKSDLWEAIDDQLLPRDVKEDIRDKFFDFICHNQSNVLLVLDGLDEVPANKLQFFSDILQGRVLPKCRLVATARHEAGKDIRIHCDTLLEIEGFTENDAKDFIFKYFKSKVTLAKKLRAKLFWDGKLKEMAANPLNTALLCLFCEEFQGVFPDSRTELYIEIVQCILRRYIQKKGLSENNEDLIEAYKPQLRHLGLIALNGLQEDSLDFDESELGNHSADLPGFGFLSVQQGGSKLRPRRRYSFHHKSFQEFFAAFYLCCRLLDKEITPDSVATETRYLHGLKEVLKFTCGLLAARCEETATALVKSTTTQVNNEGDSNCLSVLLKCINECKKDNSTFHLTLASVSGSLLKLQKLLTGEPLTDSEVAIIAETVKWNSSLKEVCLLGEGIGAGVPALAEALRENSSLTWMNLSFGNVNDAGATDLAEALRDNSSLTELSLFVNDIGCAGATALAKTLRVNSSLTGMVLVKNNIGDDGSTALAEALKENSSLTWLFLSGNNIGDVGAVGLAEALRENSSLTDLYLCQNNIGDAGAVGLAEALRENSSLTTLELAGNNIGDDGAAGIAKALRRGESRLTKLDLSSNKISDAGVSGLEEALRENLSLTELKLSNNNIDDGGAAEASRENSIALWICSTMTLMTLMTLVLLDWLEH